MRRKNIRMEIVALLGIIYFLLGSCVCLMICVNPNDPGILGKFRKLCFVTIPNIFSSIIRKLFGQRALECLGGVKHYIAETNHPLVQWFYFLIAVGGFIGYAIKGIFKHMPNPSVNTFMVITAYVLAGICFWVYYKACATSPGEITKQREQEYVENFKEHYDGIMYKEKNECKTCKVMKPARSKHCSICEMCVSKFDHHCIWIRQCVGQKNYKYFISFLFLHSIWCSYLSIIGTLSLYQSLLKMNFWNVKFRVGGQMVQGDNLLALQYVFIVETLFFFLIIMCAIMGVTLFIFVSYHFYLIKEGQTTNERVKKNDYIDYLKKEKKNLEKFKKENPTFEKEKEVKYRGEKMPIKEFEHYVEDIEYRLAVMTKQRHNPGFISNLRKVFSEPDN